MRAMVMITVVTDLVTDCVRFPMASSLVLFPLFSYQTYIIGDVRLQSHNCESIQCPSASSMQGTLLRHLGALMLLMAIYMMLI